MDFPGAFFLYWYFPPRSSYSPLSRPTFSADFTAPRFAGCTAPNSSPNVSGPRANALATRCVTGASVFAGSVAALLGGLPLFFGGDPCTNPLSCLSASASSSLRRRTRWDIDRIASTLSLIPDQIPGG